MKKTAVLILALIAALALASCPDSSGNGGGDEDPRVIDPLLAKDGIWMQLHRYLANDEKKLYSYTTFPDDYEGIIYKFTETELSYCSLQTYIDNSQVFYAEDTIQAYSKNNKIYSADGEELISYYWFGEPPFIREYRDEANQAGEVSLGSQLHQLISISSNNQILLTVTPENQIMYFLIQ